jgi:hypothetical protein
MNDRIPVRIENNLRDTCAVTQIDEKQAAVVATLVHPSHQDSFFPGVGNT